MVASWTTYFSKKNIEMSIYQIDLDQIQLIYETYDLRYEIVIKSLNPCRNKIERSIIMNKALKAGNEKI